MLDAGCSGWGEQISRDCSAAVRAGSIGSAVAIHSEPACGRHVTFGMHNVVPGARSSVG
jgi:hypothetical protein